MLEDTENVFSVAHPMLKLVPRTKLSVKNIIMFCVKQWVNEYNNDKYLVFIEVENDRIIV